MAYQFEDLFVTIQKRFDPCRQTSLPNCRESIVYATDIQVTALFWNECTRDATGLILACGPRSSPPECTGTETTLRQTDFTETIRERTDMFTPVSLEALKSFKAQIAEGIRLIEAQQQKFSERMKPATFEEAKALEGKLEIALRHVKEMKKALEGKTAAAGD